MYRRLLVFITKILIKLLRLAGKNGSALPGLIIERLYPGFLEEVLSNHDKKIVLITGTNGKTTTTKMLVAALRGTGKKVVTNGTGSNMTRGLIAALLDDMSLWGSLRRTDWFVFEMDEAYAPVFTAKISPKVIVALNVLRDQLDRYGELDKTARLIGEAGMKAETFIYNGLDPLLSSVASGLKEQEVSVLAFDAIEKLLSKVANEQTVHGGNVVSATDRAEIRLLEAKETENGQEVVVEAADRYDLTLPVKGFHNALNIAAVVAVLDQLAPEQVEKGLTAISKMAVPFGRGEQFHLQGKDITVALVKNPAGFASNLETFVKRLKPEAVLFVVNDNFADGRDVSWLWDVPFKGEIPEGTQLYTSGVRGYDMGLRLKHDGLESHTMVPIRKMMQYIMKSDIKNVVIIPTYTALFEVRSELSRYGKVPRIW
jgi:lipid II isoglutaminyl synthase (glutamine-hydrolysing)